MMKIRNNRFGIVVAITAMLAMLLMVGCRQVWREVKPANFENSTEDKETDNDTEDEEILEIAGVTAKTATLVAGALVISVGGNITLQVVDTQGAILDGFTWAADNTVLTKPAGSTVSSSGVVTAGIQHGVFSVMAQKDDILVKANVIIVDIFIEGATWIEASYEGSLGQGRFDTTESIVLSAKIYPEVPEVKALSVNYVWSIPDIYEKNVSITNGSNSDVVEITSGAGDVLQLDIPVTLTASFSEPNSTDIGVTLTTTHSLDVIDLLFISPVSPIPNGMILLELEQSVTFEAAILPEGADLAYDNPTVRTSMQEFLWDFNNPSLDARISPTKKLGTFDIEILAVDFPNQAAGIYFPIALQYYHNDNQYAENSYIEAVCIIALKNPITP